MKESSVEEEQSAKTEETFSESDDLEHKYYAISFPSGATCEEVPMGKPLVLENKTEALRIIKQYKGARFKEFTNKTDAIKFASDAVTCPSPAPDSAQFTAAAKESDLTKESSNLKSVTSQQIVKLRKAIEKGDIYSFKRTVWENPRYLVTGGDFPTTMQEGSHYNALHIAARFKREIFCELILNTIQDPAFFKLIYEDDTNEARMERIRHVTDLYLNTPDKALCETPLHFAAKFGCLQMIRTLLSHPLCDKTKTNKYGLTAEQMICERCPSCSDGLKQEIAEAFETLYYVPVLRQDGNLMPAIIGKPCLAHVIKSSSYAVSNTHSFDVYQNSLSVKAYAGPMPFKVADAFYTIWKNPGSPQPVSYSAGDQKTANEIRLSDLEKGLERLGRALAEDFGTKWTEYWPALDAWLNLASPEGLDKFESYLERKLQDRSIMEQKELNALVSSVSDHFQELATELVCNDSLAENIVDKHLCVFDNLLHCFEEMYCILKTEKLNYELRLIHSNLATLLNASLRSSMNAPSITDVKNRFKLCLCPSIGQTIEKVERPDVVIPLQHLLCVLNYFCDDESSPNQSVCKCLWKKEFCANPHLGAIFNNIISGHIKFCQTDEKKECSSGDFNEAFKSVIEALDSAYLDELMGYSTEFMDAEEVFSTPPETPHFKTPSRCVDNFEDVTEYWSPVSKHDIDMCVALKNCDVDPQRYPCVYKWRKFVRATLLKQTSKAVTPLSLAAPKLSCRFPKASEVRKTLF